MRTDERKAALRQVEIFAGLPDAAIDRIARNCNWRDYDAGQGIVAHRDASSDILFLLGGKARVVNYSADGTPVLFVDLVAPSMFGEISAIDRKPRSASVEALDRCTVAVLPARAFEDLLRHEPAVAIATLRHVAAETRRLSERVFEFSTMMVRERVQAELVRLAAETGRTQGEAVLSPAPSLSDIASRISTHREAVSRELSRLTGLGLLERVHGDLRIPDIARLSRLVDKVKGE